MRQRSDAIPATGSIGVLGVGRMGRPIADALARAGFDVPVFDTDPLRMPVPGDSLRPAVSAAALAAGADVLVTVLPGPGEVEDALAGEHGILRQLRPGSCWLDLTSNDPRRLAALAAEAAALGVLSVEAPMGGGVRAAEAASLTFFVSGARPAVEAAMPVLEALAAPAGIHHLGSAPGAGTTAKLLANLLWFGQSIAVTEALLLGTALGVDLPALREALAASAGGSRFIDEHLGALLAGDYLADFGLDRVVEELDTLSGLAEATGTPFELSAVVTGIHREALAEFGAVDGELLAARLLELRAGAALAEFMRRPGSGSRPSPGSVVSEE